MSAHLAKAHAITIPTNGHYDGWGTRSVHFKIPTTHGELDIEAGRCGSIWCRGTPEAIIAFGLVDPDWLPGLPGRGATAQTVYFEESSPWLPCGQNRRGRRPKGPRITIRAWGHITRTVDVQAPLSDVQREAVGAIRAIHEASDAAESFNTEANPIRPAFHVVGNVVYLLPRVEGRAAP